MATPEPPEETYQSYLERTLGTGSDPYRTVVPALFERLEAADEDSDVVASYRLWQESVDVNISKVESKVVDTVAALGIDTTDGTRAEEFLYCLQSYYALVLHLDRVVSMARLVDGVDPEDAPADLRAEYPNLLDGPEDRLFHGWLTGLDFAAEPFDALVAALADTPPRTVGEDAYKDLYQDLIGNPFRKALGEFYTREWLADLILDEIGYTDGSLLDPTCGSGAFLVKAARRVLEVHDDPAAVDRVHGFDLNPVAVMATKSNLLGVLAGHFEAGALTHDELAAVDLPVYWTNGIVRTQPDLSGNVVTVLSPYGELEFPRDPDEAVAKVAADVREWVEGRPFERLVDDRWLDNIARSFTAPLAEPPFDFVVGNPPWVSPDRMPKAYRDRVEELLEESGFLEPFDPDYLPNRFPNSQFVAALPFFEVAMDRYLTANGVCAYLVTSSLLKSMNGGGFREQMREWNVGRILDFTPYTDIHQHASSWAFVPVIDNAAADGEPTHYEFFSPTDGEMPSHPGDCRTLETPDVTLHVCEWDVDVADLPFLPEDPRSPWFTAPPEVLDAYRTVVGENPHAGEHYRFTRGLVTGRNAVYLLDDPTLTDGLVEASTKAAGGRVTLESDLVYPFVEGKHLSAWTFDHTHLLLPYEVPSWDPIPETDLERDYPETAAYLDANREGLEGRRTHTITSQMDSGSPYYVVETRELLGTRPVVGLREVAPYLEAAVLPSTIEDDLLGERESIVAHTLNFVVPESEPEAYFLAGLLNSWPIRSLVYDLAQPKGGRPGKRFDMYLVSSLPIPTFDPDDPAHERVAELGREAHELADADEDLEDVETELNAVVCEDVYGISIADGEALRDHYRRLSYTP